MNFFSIFAVIALILAISFGQSEGHIIKFLDQLEQGAHKLAQGGIKLVKPIEDMFSGSSS
ncbi:andropin-like [Drosophila eugracilis]|uniref:andropin-like n=1 Tax=Drosophila eugracilis TaxID=29029 RepID=UPI0007E728C2|nr:andropin-like [Drosophila eugracilis]